MWRLCRLALMWLLAVTVPLQGITATVMLNCSPAQHAAADTVAAEHGHGSAESAAPGQADRLHDDAAHLQTADHHADAGTAADHTCSACFSCCVGMAIPARAISFQSFDLTELFAPLVPSRIAAFQSEGVERPPRPLLA